ncbi:hypothetical protein H5410_059522 [Solanum commersonii]|uniref:Uncharacterized protein n=1 Tax=Solanum commersonii TaxID=4109 RepID=A0A9J5W385_SOLCO|nr:hypothetical protein H5410_059522 [Solanum commersonii]
MEEVYSLRNMAYKASWITRRGEWHFWVLCMENHRENVATILVQSANVDLSRLGPYVGRSLNDWEVGRVANLLHALNVFPCTVTSPTNPESEREDQKKAVKKYPLVAYGGPYGRKGMGDVLKERLARGDQDEMS